jgi:hypothetical protein
MFLSIGPGMPGLYFNGKILDTLHVALQQWFLLAPKPGFGARSLTVTMGQKFMRFSALIFLLLIFVLSSPGNSTRTPRVMAQ